MTVRGIDFAKQSMMDALDLAILVEEEAQERYEEFAQQMEQHRTFEAASFFRHMVENEAKHGRELSARRVQRFGTAPRKVTRAMLYDVEAPDYDAARAFMSPRQAMEAALGCEIKAQAFFDEVRALFLELRDEEIQHQALVQAELDRLGPDGPDAADFVDEPVAQ
jgi:rubrerythrin